MAREVLGHRAASLLGAALVARTAARSGIRVILVKGLSLEFHELRKGRVAADVDVLVEPGRSKQFVEILRAGDWVARPTPFGATRMTTHSATLLRDGWPTDLDVHHRYPGVLASPATAFEVLWRNRQAVNAAGVAVWIPDRSSCIVLWALHSLRGRDTDTRAFLELEELAGVIALLGDMQRGELALRIAELGADRPLLDVAVLSPFLGEHRQPVDAGAVFAWERKMAQASDSTPWLQVLREAPKWQWPWIVWRAVWPSANDVRLIDEDLVDTAVGRAKSRFRRMGRLVTRVLERPGASSMRSSPRS